jgi:predicted metal-binding protein
MIPDNIKLISKSVISNQELIQEALDCGCTKAKVVLTQTISMAHWVNLHCQFGCSQYGKLLTCPPCTPDTDEMAEILTEYEKALLINVNSDTNVQKLVVRLENSFKQKGYTKAFGLGAQPCNLCDPCTVSTFCQHPEKARPTLQACGIDVKNTVLKNGWTELADQKPCSESHSIGMILIS